MVKIKLDYVTKLPKINGIPNILIDGLNDNKNYKLIFFDKINDEIIEFENIKNGVFKSNKQWFSDWEVLLLENNNLIYHHKTNLNGKSCFIKFDSYALGDTLAWIPYVEEFRLKHNCNVICSTFFNELVKDLYPNILFVEPNLNIYNIYYQIYIGASNDSNKIYSPMNVNDIPLQSVATNILGLNFKEIRPELDKIHNGYIHNKKYICISEFASDEVKMWKEPNGWQRLVDYLVSIDYDVFVISKEKTNLKNVIDLTGDKPLKSRCELLKNAKMFIGVSSGLSWLAWAMNTHVVMISDVTPTNHEFQSNTTRISTNINLNQVKYDNDKYTTFDELLIKLEMTLPNSLKNYGFINKR